MVRVPQVVEEGLHVGLHVQTVEPQREDAGFPLALGVKVLHLELLLFGDRIKCGVGVEQVGDEGKVELGVSGDERRGSQELSAAKAVGVVKHGLGPLEKILDLQRTPVDPVFRSNLRKKNGIVLSVFDVGREVAHPVSHHKLAGEVVATGKQE